MKRAARATVDGGVDHEAVAARARELGVLGWVRPTGEIHAEGDPAAVQTLLEEFGAAAEKARVEGHEQFGIRGVSAGVFVVQEHQATAHHYDFRLEVDGVMKSWAVPKGPSLDPAVKRFAVQVDDHGMAHNDYEGERVIIWDRGTYEQGGRVAWPEAIERGHAVFVLHGEKLHGGFALQRTGGGAKPQWLLIKRKDDEARPGTDITAERPESVVSGRRLALRDPAP
ncbi:acylphosphatase [Solirubrobacter soli]|uniref:acylphosphatase n=1 Tax=Solirubrobacter soli TaxID=363832 RepID=UPI00041417DD|nr:DNA polymerase ligase N-terminal domain-containing protein [Solirubrobacter soli]